MSYISIATQYLKACERARISEMNSEHAPAILWSVDECVIIVAMVKIA